MKLTIFHLFGLLNKNTAKEDDDSDKQNASETLSKHNNNNNNDGDSDDNSRSNNSRSNCNNNDETKKSMNNDDDTDRCNGSTTKTTSTIAWRELISFWIFGLCTEFGYVVMICAAYDILSRFDNKRLPSTDGSDATEKICTEQSPGILLLADIVPSLMMSLVCPFLPLFKHFRMTIVVLLQTTSFLLIAFAQSQFQAILGVVCTSLALGLGEVTLLSTSAEYNKRVIKAWASGTGGAGIFGSLSYASLIALGIPPQYTLLMFLTMPALEAITFWMLLPPSTKRNRKLSIATIELDMNLNVRGLAAATQYGTQQTQNITTPTGKAKTNGFREELKRKLLFLPSMLKFMMPLMFVFICEYVIISGLLEMIYVRDSFMNHESQFRWFQVVYQIGLFVGRTFGTLLPVQSVWWLTGAQFVNVLYFTFEVTYYRSSSIWTIFALIFLVGTDGGLSFVHTFWKLAKQLPQSHQEFGFGMLTIAESIGVALGGCISIPIHNVLCRRLVVL